MTEQRFIELIESNNWKEASTYTDTHPHAYLIKEKFQPSNEWYSFQEYLWKNAKPQKWFQQTYLYYVYKEFIIFTCDSPLNKDKDWITKNNGCINRASIWNRSGWQKVTMESGETFYILPRPHVATDVLRDAILSSNTIIGKTRVVIKGEYCFYVSRRSGVVATKTETFKKRL